MPCKITKLRPDCSGKFPFSSPEATLPLVGLNKLLEISHHVARNFSSSCSKVTPKKAKVAFGEDEIPRSSSVEENGITLS